LKLAPGLVLGDIVTRVEAQERATRKPTQWNEIGPFYKRLAPNQTQLRTAADPGLPLSVRGVVFSTTGAKIPGATIEVWQADHHGRYDLDGYRFRAKLAAAADGAYSIETVMPGHYPARVCQHVHYLVTSSGHKPLITQLYFATDPVFEGDSDHNYDRDPLVLSRELVRPVTLHGDAGAVHSAVTFDLVLERL
jgi:protocatechuate 3,4-dioxygenase beta subunit